MNKILQIDKLKKQIDKYDIISFDIFDTLIKRNVSSPQKIFQIIENRYNSNNEVKIIDFSKNRQLAQKQARLNHLKDDYNINEIYDILKKIYTSNECEKLMKLEINTEIEFCVKNKIIYKIYDYCLKKKKKIICISDMYLDTITIRKILNNNGYNKIEKIYISSECGLRKANGKIFDFVLKIEQVDRKKLLHIGDSKKGDYIFPKMKGIKSILIPTNFQNLTYHNYNKKYLLEDDIFYSTINNFIDPYMNICEKRGYEVFGPVLVGYIHWLHNKFSEKNVKNVFFCSRDMKIISDNYFKYYDDVNIRYIYISRKSVRGAYLYLYHSLNEIIEILSVKKMDILQYLKIVNVSKEDAKKFLIKYELDLKDFINLNNPTCNFRKFSCEIEPIIKNNNLENYNLLKKYLESINFVGKVALIDCGWNATTQYCLNKIFPNIIINGFYLGLENNAYTRINSKFLNCYIFGKNYNLNFQSEIISIKQLFELIISASHGSVIGYKQDNFSVIPILEKFNNDSGDFVSYTQKGIQKLIDDFSKIETINSLDSYMSSLHNFIIQPKLEDSKIFTKFTTNNLEKQINYSVSNSFMYYLFHINKFKKDLSYSSWKVGFLKSIFRIKFPYYKMYLILKSKKNRQV